MYVFDNPVLQRELLVNLRASRSFFLLLVYQTILALVVFMAWPQQQRLDLTESPDAARNLVDLFFLGQYLLASLMTPAFTAGALTGEKERKTYESLLASPLGPAAIILGKLLAGLTHLAILIFASLPIVMLCLPLGGVSPYEVLAAYLGLILSVFTFGMIGIACSSYFQRTAAALLVSYLLILPLAIAGVLAWIALSKSGELRLLLTVTLLPALALSTAGTLFYNTCDRLLYPPDVGSEGKEVVDLATESHEAVGLVIQSDQFPDYLFAPAKRDDLMEDGCNPVYEKEIRSEIFSQGTLMLRVVIQISMFLALPVLATCLFIRPEYAAWYIAYVVMFNMIVGPVFSAGTVTSERERETLDLLLTTIITPWQILSGKLLAGLRVSSVLTFFVLWPVLLAAVLNVAFHTNLLAILSYIAVCLTTCVVTALVALFCSVVFQKTASSQIAAYALIVLFFCGPPAGEFFARHYMPDAPLAESIRLAGVASPFSAIFETPLRIDPVGDAPATMAQGSWAYVGGYFLFSALLVALLMGAIAWLFETRWRVAGGGESDVE